MTLKHRIIPIILTQGAFFAVQTTKFQRPARMIGTTLQLIENMEKRNVDELIILDIDGRIVKNKEWDKLKNLTKNLFCPLTFGGGISTLDDIKRLIQDCGIDKVSIRTNFSLIYSVARTFGSQAIVYSADVYRAEKDNTKYCIRGLSDRMNKRFDMFKWLKLIEKQGAGEILLTDVNQNGTYQGYNEKLIWRVSKELKIPIIANGGCGSISDMEKAIKAGASAVAASSLFALRNVTPLDCARGLQEAGLAARVG